MLKSLFVCLLLSILFHTGRCQNTTQSLYKKSLKFVIGDIKLPLADSLLILSDNCILEFSKIPEMKFKIADAHFFEGICCDTSIFLIKLMPIEISKEGLIIGISYLNFIQKSKNKSIINITNYYSYYKFDCSRQIYRLYKREKKSI